LDKEKNKLNQKNNQVVNIDILIDMSSKYSSFGVSPQMNLKQIKKFSIWFKY